ncbi:hypothetical protein PMAYCL1PPCAC_00409, partial [Pristionchus mayeri]
QNMNDIITFTMSLLTLIINIILVLILSRKPQITTISQRRRFNSEKGLIVTSVTSYAFYVLFQVNYVLSRYFKVWFSGHIQLMFLGLSSIAPFWCLMLFADSIRRAIFK